jgi:hypothetical protein
MPTPPGEHIPLGGVECFWPASVGGLYFGFKKTFIPDFAKGAKARQ